MCNINVDIYFCAYYYFLENPSSATLEVGQQNNLKVFGNKKAKRSRSPIPGEENVRFNNNSIMLKL